MGQAASVRRTSGDNRPVVEQRFRVGDTVALKSGGPPMTVQALSLSLAYCAWKNAAGQVHHGTFEVDTLDLLHHGPSRAAQSSKGSGGQPAA
jgi:uncharacterized protein YodC (DUF2158 family)